MIYKVATPNNNIIGFYMREKSAMTEAKKYAVKSLYQEIEVREYRCDSIFKVRGNGKHLATLRAYKELKRNRIRIDIEQYSSILIKRKETK